MPGLADDTNEGLAVTSHATSTTAIALFQRYAWGRGVLVAAAYFALVLCFSGFRGVYEFDPDEGHYLMLARLLHAGHGMYTDIWNEQTPLFSYLTVWWCQLFGWDVNTVRLLVVTLACCQLFAIYDAVRLMCGDCGALVACICLVLSRHYWVLSFSVMGGLPSLAFAVVAFWMLVRWNHHRRPTWLIASGVVYAASLLTKFFTAFLAPLFPAAVLLLVWQWEPHRWRGVRAIGWAAVWTLAAGSVFLISMRAVAPSEVVWDVLLMPTETQGHFDASGSGRWVANVVAREWPMIGLATLSVPLLLTRRLWVGLLPVAWFAVGVLALANHAPLWYHHTLLLSVPASILSGCAVGLCLQRPWFRLPRQGALDLQLLRVAAVVFVVLLVHQNVQRAADHGGRLLRYDVPTRGNQHREFVSRLMRELAPHADIVVVDRAMVAYRAGYTVPPRLCVLSEKRYRSGELSLADVIGSIDGCKPPLVFLNRVLFQSRLHAAVRAHLEEEYELVYSVAGFGELYAEQGLVPNPIPAFEEAIKHVGMVPEAHYALGCEYEKRGLVAQAEQSYSRSCRLQRRSNAACERLKILEAAGEND